MNKVKPLIIDKRDKVKGLFVYCQKCQRLIDNRTCGITKKRISTCKSSEQHMFKAIIPIPGTGGTKRKTRTFKTRDVRLAIQLKIEFEQELEDNNFQSRAIFEGEAEMKSDLLIECMAMYLGYLHNEGVESHMVKVRTEKHLNEVEYYFKLFCLSLKESKIDHTLIKMKQINDKTVAIFHNYLVYKMKYANKTYNKAIALHRQFVNWLITKKDYEIINAFNNVIRKKITVNKTIVTYDEFNVLLKKIKPENGYQVFSSGIGKQRYKKWLKNALCLALHTGLRREEFMSLKFSNISYDKNNKPQFIVVENFKVNRINGDDGEVGQKKYVPITSDLLEVLTALELEKYRGSENYLLGNEEKSSRATLIDYISKAFQHFWKQTGIEKPVQLKSLRKTYLTALVIQYGDKAPVISNHSGIEVLKNHYVNDEQLASATKDFSVFKKKSEE